MTFDEVKNYIKEFKIQNLKVTDINGKKIMEFIQEHSPENIISKLQTYAPSLQTYGRVNFIAANDTQYKQNWKDCYSWPVVFSGISNHLTVQEQPKQQIGFVSQNEATLMAQVQSMQLQMDFYKKFAELEAKLATPKEDKYERLIDKYFPIIGPMMGLKMDPDQMQQMMAMYQLQNAMNGKTNMAQQNTTQGMAGIQHTPTLQQTEEEKKTEQEIVNEMCALSQKTTDQNILSLLKGLNQKPELIQMALNFLQPK